MLPRRAQLSDRDLAVVRHVRDVRHATTGQIQRMFFHANASGSPGYAVVNRLVKQGYLHKTKRFAPVAGGGFNVISLARPGHELLSDERFERQRSFVSHALAVGECVVMLHELERAGALELTGLDVEPDCHTVVGGAHLKPDLYVRMHHHRHGDLRLWLEIDLATEGPARIHGKLRLYRQAFHNYTAADKERWPVMPRVLWVAIDEDRDRKLNRLIDEIPEGDRKIFRVTTFEKLPNILS